MTAVLLCTTYNRIAYNPPYATQTNQPLAREKFSVSPSTDNLFRNVCNIATGVGKMSKSYYQLQPTELRAVFTKIPPVKRG
jgi:hypothetical protein